MSRGSQLMRFQKPVPLQRVWVWDWMELQEKCLQPRPGIGVSIAHLAHWSMVDNLWVARSCKSLWVTLPLSLLNRGLMCVLRHSYVFIESRYSTRQRLWPSVKKELEIFRGLMALGTADLFAPWDSGGFCTDACLSGYAVMRGDLSALEASGIGRCDERWRFRRGDGAKVAPRSRALDTSAVFSDPITVKPEITGEILGELEEVPDFPEVGKKFLEPDRWRLLWRAPILHKEPVHIIEARSILGAVKHRSRDHHAHGTRILVLNDNMGVVLACQKGRCSNYPLLRIVRRISAHALAAGLRVYVRWIPSELNAADKDSRWFEPKQDAIKPCQSQEEKQERGGGFLSSRSAKVEQSNEEPQSRGACPKEEVPLTIPDEEHGELQRQTSFWSIESTFERGGSETEESKTEADKEHQEVESDSGRKIHPGAGKCERSNTSGLLEEARRVLSFCRIPRSELARRERAGRGPLRLCRRAVSERRGQSRGRQTAGSLRVREARGNAQWSTSASTVQESSERMEKDGTHTGANANGGVHQKQHHWDVDTFGREGDGTLQRGDLLHIRSPWRNVEDIPSRRGGSQQHLSPRCHSSRSHGAERKFQSRNLRRNPDSGRRSLSVVGDFDEGSCREKGVREQGGSATLGLHRPKVFAKVESLCANPGGARCGSLPVSEPTRRCKSRHAVETEKCSSHQPKGSVGNRCQRSHLQQTREASADHQSVQSSLGAVRRRCEAELRGLSPEWKGPFTSSSSKASDQLHGSVNGKAFLSLFGGVGNPAEFWCECGGESALIDYAFSPANDLSKFSVWNQILRVLIWFSVVGIDLPCNTWSRARRAPEWSRLPKPLRSREHIFGLPNLKPSDQQKVLAANRMFFGAVRVIRKCLKIGVAGYLENPASSWVWETPQMLRLMQHPQVCIVRVDMCQYDVQWKKPTKLLFFGVAPMHLLTCTGKSVCSRTNKKHLQLSGIVGKRFLTEQAQIYSKAFSQQLMLSFFPKTSPTL